MKNELSKQLDDLLSAEDFAIGNDLVFVPDFVKSLTDDFKKKVYTVNEIAYCDMFTGEPELRYASTWAAKEAVYKAMKQIDPAPLSWKKIEILREKTAGKPVVIIHKEEVNHIFSLTVSHDGDYVWAIALIKTGLKQ